MTVSVSVILPSYGRPDSLKVACESVLSQSYRDLELIVIDDASEIALLPVVEALEDDRVRYVRHEVNGGPAKARNTGLKLAQGRFIAFQDSDDMWLPDKLSRQIEKLESLPDDVGVVTGSKILYGRDEFHNYGPGKVTCAPPPDRQIKLDDDQVRRFFFGNRISLQNAVFRRDCFPEIEWFDPCARANEDWDFTVRLVQHTKVYEALDPVVLSFISTDSISRNTRRQAIGTIRVLKKNQHVLAAYPDAHTRILLYLAQALMTLGRKRAAKRLIRKALRIHPAKTLAFVTARVPRALRKRLPF
ncbi:glycosyltransferase family 2 protein [Ruegeria sp. Ofav3-42]|uniref:glycosyltransferase family 2 protein n=1 Tax=Ruegeria sp. Ofav3-42 TaxID=2917759 RepID=UPI001EF43DF1|nr:glycosyltransferase family 2 protein [Ruegeria sp. Ofav3-42]MCG7522409.1 glycosyltransferase [Ruegeria sp. Ofav3-42]